MTENVPQRIARVERGKVVRGKDGWLFLEHDSNRIMDQQSGRLRFRRHELLQWRYVLESRIAWLERIGIPYVFMVVPNAASLYPEMLPEGYETVEDRPINQLIGYLEESGSFAPVIYPLEELTRAKAEDLIWLKNDTHWNEIGAFAAYERLADELEKLMQIERVRRSDVEFEDSMVIGDLGAKLDPPEAAWRPLANVRDSRARLLADNRTWGGGREVIYERQGAPGSCFVFGDSYAYTIFPFLCESVGRLVFGHRPSLDFEMVMHERPSVVVNIMIERFLIRMPFDQPYRPLRALARDRLKKGFVLPPPTGDSLRIGHEWARELRE
jgi:acetyltransferase AlgX (SGNH hydrolase-like protein)